MLFDLANDISEQNNLLWEQPEKARELFKKLFAWEATLQYPRFRTSPFWLKNNAERYDHSFTLVQPPGKRK